MLFRSQWRETVAWTGGRRGLAKARPAAPAISSAAPPPAIPHGKASPVVSALWADGRAVFATGAAGAVTGATAGKLSPPSGAAMGLAARVSARAASRTEEHKSERPSPKSHSYTVICFIKKNKT